MTVKRFIFRAWVRSLECLLMLAPWRHDTSWYKLMSEPTDEGELDVVVIAFNNPFVIEQQIHFMRRNMAAPYKYIVVDNSSDKGQRGKIRDVCTRYGADYVSMPPNRLSLVGFSYSHAGALNWTYRKIIRRRRPAFFGFLDHDLFPVKGVDIRARLKGQPIYGLLKECGTAPTSCWYLWAGLCFFRFDFVRGKRVDFMPVTPFSDYLDTGGGNWYPLYSKMSLGNLTLARMEYVEFPEMAGRLDDKMALMDGGVWLHTTNGSNWKGKDEQRNAVVDAVMRRFL